MPNTPTESRRVIMRIELLEQAKQEFTGMSDRWGMTQVAISSRLIEWFAEQTDVVQAIILGLYPEEMRPEVTKMILKHIAADKKK